MTDAKYFRDLAAQCRRLAQLSREPEMSAELNEIADALIIDVLDIGGVDVRRLFTGGPAKAA